MLILDLDVSYLFGFWIKFQQLGQVLKLVFRDILCYTWLDLLDLSSRGIAVAWGQHDISPLATVPGLQSRLLHAQSDDVQIPRKHISPPRYRSPHRSPTLHCRVHYSLHLPFISHSLNLSKPLQSYYSQLNTELKKNSSHVWFCIFFNVNFVCILVLVSTAKQISATGVQNLSWVY